MLHEEVLRGVHVLSVGNLPAGSEVEVTVRWANALDCQGTTARLRIPMTIGCVYGISGLPDADEPVHGAAPLAVPLTIRHDAVAVRLADAALQTGPEAVLSATVSNDAPIDLHVEGWNPDVLRGQTADGRSVELSVAPAPRAVRD